MRYPLAVLALALGVAAASAQHDAHPTFTVGTATAKRGEVAYGALIVPPGVDSGTSMPVAVIHGAKPGPVLALVAGAHGTEYASIIALSKIIAQIDPKTLSGTVIVAPLLNARSFEGMIVHVNPIDHKSMNGFYPGDPAGTITQRALGVVAEQIVKQADAVVDLHGGDLDEDLRPYSYWMRTGDAKLDSANKQLALVFGLEYIILFDVDITKPEGRRNLSSYAVSQGKLAVVAEAGRSGVSSAADVGALIDGCLNVMGSMKMIARAAPPLAHPVWVSNDQRVAAAGPGMFYATALRGEYVIAGAKLGYTTDYLGRPTGDVVAPVTGVITFIRGVPSMWKGAALVVVGEVSPEPPPYQTPKP
jgi:predicted deacylase